jgi:hypothetical protein
MTTVELSNHIACCVNRFADFTCHFEYDHHFSHLNDSKDICSTASARLVTSDEFNEQAVHIVRCTGSERWRKRMLPRHDSVLLRVETSSNSNFLSNAGLIPTPLQCPFFIKDSELVVIGLLALVRSCPKGMICHATGMVMVGLMHPPLRQPLHNGCYCRNPCLCVRTTYIVPISDI